MAAKTKTTTVSDADAGFYDDIPVVRANGDTDRLGNVDTSVVEAEPVVAPRKTRLSGAKTEAQKDAARAAKPKAPAQAPRTAAPRGPVKAQAKTATRGKAGAVAKTLTKAEKATAAATLKAKNEAAQKRKDEAQKKADAKQLRLDKAAQRKEDAETRAEQRKLEAEQRAAAKLAAQGLTGDPVADAEFTAVIQDARALAVRPLPPSAVNLTWMQAPGVALTPTGLMLDESVGLNVWAKTVSALQSLGDVSQFALGDALVFGEAHFGNQYEHVTQTLGITKSAVKNIKYVAGIWPVDERVEGLSFTHHQEAAWLYKSDPAEARNILEKAKYELRPASWVREMVQAYRANQAGEGDVFPKTPAQTRQDANDLLVLATTEQAERDLALKGSPRKIAKAIHDELVAFIDYSERNMEVPAESALRQITRLQHRIDELVAENVILRERITQLEKSGTYRADANVRILDGEGTDLGAGSDSDLVTITEDDDLLAYLNTGEADDEDDPDDDALADEDFGFGDEG